MESRRVTCGWPIGPAGSRGGGPGFEDRSRGLEERSPRVEDRSRGFEDRRRGERGDVERPAKASRIRSSPRTTATRSCAIASAGVTSPPIRRRTPGPGDDHRFGLAGREHPADRRRGRGELSDTQLAAAHDHPQRHIAHVQLDVETRRGIRLERRAQRHRERVRRDDVALVRIAHGLESPAPEREHDRLERLPVRRELVDEPQLRIGTRRTTPPSCSSLSRDDRMFVGIRGSPCLRSV